MKRSLILPDQFCTIQIKINMLERGNNSSEQHRKYDQEGQSVKHDLAEGELFLYWSFCFWTWSLFLFLRHAIPSLFQFNNCTTN